MQNGSPDGLALVDSANEVVEFISYEGTFTAGNGPAAGMMSTNVGVFEPNFTPLGFSLQLAGTGAQRSDFTWQPAGPNTQDAPNTGQVFDGCADCGPPEGCDDGIACTVDDCIDNQCVHTPSDELCDDDNNCTLDKCGEGSGCLNVHFDCPPGYVCDPQGDEPCVYCPDLNDDGTLGAFELANLLGSWGPCDPFDNCVIFDVDLSGAIGAFDLATLLGAWGACP